MARIALCMALCMVVAHLSQGPGAAQEADPVSLYVAPDGNDAWSGSLPAPEGNDGPFATLARAQAAVRALIAQGPLTQDVTVFVRGGSYRLSEALALGAEDSGSDVHPVVWRAYEDETPELQGALPITGFQPWKGDILQADLKGTPLDGTVFRQLFFKGERMEMARYPNKDPEDPHFGTWAYVLEVDGPAVKDHFTSTDDVIKDWTKPEYADICIHPAYGWAWNTVPLKGVDRETRTISLARNVSYDLRVGDRYFVRNLLEELDAPGEWYLDRDSSTLYFWPPADLAEGEVLAPVTGSLVTMDGAQRITVRGFTMEACDGTAVSITDSDDCQVAESTIRNCGSWAVSIMGGHRSGAFGNDIYATGAGGVSVRGGDRATLERGDNFATNNYIHHIAEFQRTYNTGVNINGVGNTASHNLIHDCYHQGILMGGNDNVVEFNVVHHTNLGSEDTGGLYMSSRDYSVRGNVIRHNIFHHVGGFGKASSWTPVRDGRVKFEYPHFTWGVYLDAPETGVQVYGNVLYSVPVCGMFNHSGKDNTWENNIIVDCPAFRASVWDQDPLFKTSWTGLNKARDEWDYAKYLEKYPELARYSEDEVRQNTMFNCRFTRNIVYYTPEGGKWMRERNSAAWDQGQLVWTYVGHKDDFPEFEFDRNLIYAPEGIVPKFELTLRPEPRRLLSWDEWKATGKDPNSLFADPLFVDPENHDYRLEPGSPALTLGFEPIPFDEIGPFADEMRVSWPIVEAPGASALGEFTTERYFQLPGHEPVPANEFVARDGAPNFFAKLAAKQPVTIASFAGGNHAQGGWLGDVTAWLRQQYPDVEITVIDASICGCVRGSAFSAYRFKHDVLDKQPDLILVDFASDDAEGDTERIRSAIEGVVRQARTTSPATDIVFVYAFRVGYEDAYADDLSPDTVSAYERVAEHYGIPAINMGVRIAKMAREDALVIKTSLEEAAKLGDKPVFTLDGVYASPAAKSLYAQVIIDGLQTLSAKAVAAPHALGKPFHTGSMQRATQYAITEAMLTGDWEKTPPQVGAKDFGMHFDEIWLTKTPGATLTFKFRGSDASIFDLMGPDTGQVRVTVDGEGKGNRTQVDPWAYYQRLSALSLVSGADPEQVHTVTVELLSEAPDRSIPVEAAKKAGSYTPADFEGVALRFGCLRINGELVE